MTKLTMFIDGSEFAHPSGIRAAWGIVAQHASTNTYSAELRGRRTSLPKHHRGFYEILALWKAIRHAERNSLEPHEVSFYSDCEWVAYAGYHLHPANYSAARKKVQYRINLFKCAYYPDDASVAPTLEKWLINSRFHWVRGHAQNVGNCRADHLARVACLDEDLQEYDTWIATGFEKWDPVAGEMVRVKPAFT